MNKILIVDASASDYRVMSSLLSKAGYDPIGVDSIEAGKLRWPSCLPARLSSQQCDCRTAPQKLYELVQLEYSSD